jgi:hypothetical protein
LFIGTPSYPGDSTVDPWALLGGLHRGGGVTGLGRRRAQQQGGARTPADPGFGGGNCVQPRSGRCRLRGNPTVGDQPIPHVFARMLR